MTYTLDNEQRQTIIRQIGTGTFLACCGGRVFSLPDGIDMPCGQGYHIYVRYDRGSDYYSVERVFVRAGVTYHKGKATDIDAFQLSDVCYNASCFQMDDADYWPYDLDKGTQSKVG